NPSFSELLSRVRDVALEAYMHSDLPFEKLVEELNPKRDLGRAPYFDLMFGLQNTPKRDFELQGLTLSSLPFDHEVVKYDLIVLMNETANGLTGSWIYNRDLFDETTIERMQRHYERLLQSIAANPGSRIRELEMLSEAELQAEALKATARETANINKLRTAQRKAVGRPTPAEAG